MDIRRKPKLILLAIVLCPRRRLSRASSGNGGGRRGRGRRQGHPGGHHELRGLRLERPRHALPQSDLRQGRHPAALQHGLGPGRQAGRSARRSSPPASPSNTPSAATPIPTASAPTASSGTPARPSSAIALPMTPASTSRTRPSTTASRGPWSSRATISRPTASRSCPSTTRWPGTPTRWPRSSSGTPGPTPCSSRPGRPCRPPTRSTAAKCHGADPLLDVLQKHDDEEGTDLAANRPVLCASCHGSPGARPDRTRVVRQIPVPGHPRLPSVAGRDLLRLPSRPDHPVQPEHGPHRRGRQLRDLPRDDGRGGRLRRLRRPGPLGRRAAVRDLPRRDRGDQHGDDALPERHRATTASPARPATAAPTPGPDEPGRGRLSGRRSTRPPSCRSGPARSATTRPRAKASRSSPRPTAARGRRPAGSATRRGRPRRRRSGRTSSSGRAAELRGRPPAGGPGPSPARRVVSRFPEPYNGREDPRRPACARPSSPFSSWPFRSRSWPPPPPAQQAPRRSTSFSSTRPCGSTSIRSGDAKGER